MGVAPAGELVVKMDGYRSYKSLFKIKYRIYAIGNWSLPRPIPIDLVFLFFLMLLPAYLISKPLAGIFDTSEKLIAIFIAGVLAWLMGRVDPQGQSMPIFLASLVAYVFSNKRQDFTGQPVKVKKYRISWRCVKLE